MVRIAGGYMSSFGGTFAINVPMKVDVGVCFSPSAVSTFFRKERKAVSYTLVKKKLVLQEGKEKLSVPFLPPEEMVTLDVLSKPHKVELDMTHFRSLADVINPANSRVWAQGISFRYGMAEATDNAIIISAITDLPDELEFNLPVDSMKALMRFKSPVVGIATDERAVKFCFKDGSSLVSLCITEQMIETTRFYDGKWTPLKLKDAEDFLKIPCDTVIFDKGHAQYIQEQNHGVIEDIVAKNITTTVGKASLDTLLGVSSDLRLSDDGFRLMAVSENCRAICSTRTAQSN
jgi:hypothetical protein